MVPLCAWRVAYIRRICMRSRGNFTHAAPLVLAHGERERGAALYARPHANVDHDRGFHCAHGDLKEGRRIGMRACWSFAHATRFHLGMAKRRGMRASLACALEKTAHGTSFHLCARRFDRWETHWRLLLLAFRSWHSFSHVHGGADAGFRISGMPT